MANVPPHTHPRHEHDQYLEKVATAQWLVPTGAIIAYGGTAAPAGWKICDGTAHGSAALTTLLGSANAPDLRGKFVVGVGDSPDADTPTVYARGDKGGAETVTLTAAQSGTTAHGHGTNVATANETAEHTHGVSIQSGAMSGNQSHGHAMNSGTGASAFSSGWDGEGSSFPRTNAVHSYVSATGNMSASNVDHSHLVSGNTNGRSAAHSHTFTPSTSTAAAASAAHENRPPYYALIYIIKL